MRSFVLLQPVWLYPTIEGSDRSMFSSVLWLSFTLINERSQTVPYSGTPCFLHSPLTIPSHTDSSHDADVNARSRGDTRTTETTFYSISFSGAPTTRLHQPENSISIRFGSFICGVSQPLIFLFPKCRYVLSVGLTESISYCGHEILVVSEHLAWRQCHFVVLRLGCHIYLHFLHQNWIAYWPTVFLFYA